ncbi:MAG: energy-coupling factor transporter transmembrane protein EcfT [Gammaproteobacteria bacterium]|nr:energy-coupling factor transporter transmembrane protein EcfT [Gammaproteobacteria bacterium]MDD2928486.1 CbiQ family ECF transporter T component [Sideroxydans sp.]MDD5470582.1 CbiQ family ECF transporter T component [Sideroxydans sp.]
MPHPAIQILIWMTLAVSAQALSASGLLLLTVVLFAAAAKLDSRQLFSLIRRTRWILLSLLVVYAYSTPGIALVTDLGRYSPTLEGLYDGLMQLGRLLSMLCGLAILLSLLTQSQFISGIHALAYPLNWFGGSRERVAVRLALTLQYAEPTMRDTAADWRGAITAALQPPLEAERHVILDSDTLKAVDGVCVLLCAALLYGVWR